MSSRPELVRRDRAEQRSAGRSKSWTAPLVFAAGVLIMVLMLSIVWLASTGIAREERLKAIEDKYELLDLKFQRIDTAQKVEERVRDMQSDIVERLDRINASLNKNGEPK